MLAINVNKLGIGGLLRDENITRSLERRQVESVFPGKLYFLTKNRNAWHSTKISRYTEGDSFFATIDDAKRTAELKRGNGAYFIIHELPAIVLVGYGVSVFLVQLNSDKPFNDYLPKSPKHWISNKVESLSKSAPYYFKGIAILEILKSFCLDSGHWLKIQDDLSHVVAICEFDQSVNFFRLQKHISMKSYKSLAINGSFYLEWDEIDNKIDQGSVFNIVEVDSIQISNNVVVFNSPRRSD